MNKSQPSMVNGQWSMVNDEISQLIERFLNAQTTEAEEQTLAEYFQSAESVPEEWQPVRELFLSFQTDAYELTDSELAALTAEPAPTKRKIAPLYWFAAAAACAAILFIIGSAVLWNDAKHQNIAKTETEHIQSTPPLADPADTPPNLEGESVVKTHANQIAEAKTVSKPTDTYAPPTETDISPAIGTEVATEQAVAHDEPLIAKAETETAVPDIETKDDNLHFAAYSETDLPVINPQNMLYTEEDIRKIRILQKQALIAEAQQAIEITKYNLKQVEILLAQK